MASGISNPSPNLIESRSWLPTLSVMDRYIAIELLFPFLFGVGAFSSLGISVGALFDLIRRVSEYGLPMSSAIEIFLLKLPEFVSYSFPMSVLLATLMTYSRLSSDSELVALKGCGISVYRMIVPALVLSLLVTGLMFTFNELIVPIANYRASTTLETALGAERWPSFQEENILYQEYQEIKGDGRDEVLTRLFYARRFDGQQMYGLTVLDFTQERLNQIISAQSAVWNYAEKQWDFFDGTIYLVSADGSYSNILRFDQQKVQIPRTPLDIASSERQDPNEMNLAESWERVRLLKQRGSRTRLRRLLVRIHEKYALPFACMVFGIAGAALGSKLRRTGRGMSFAISILIIFGYYLFYSVCSALAHAEILSPLLGAWLPNLLGFIVAGFLLIRAAR
ncbi:MAG: LptF/LptG family permease [Synechococcales bacterium]|nr:LptF/LptG family permease [Synechococcales bacterium]